MSRTVGYRLAVATAGLAPVAVVVLGVAWLGQLLDRRRAAGLEVGGYDMAALPFVLIGLAVTSVAVIGAAIGLANPGLAFARGFAVVTVSLGCLVLLLPFLLQPTVLDMGKGLVTGDWPVQRVAGLLLLVVPLGWLWVVTLVRPPRDRPAPAWSVPRC